MNKYLAGLALLWGLTYSWCCKGQFFDKTFSKIKSQKELTIDTSKKLIRNNVLFTIDDWPSIYANEIAKTLDSLWYQWIFFVVTRWINQQTKWDLIKILKMWHHIWNHSYSHPNFQNLNLEEIKYEILQSDSIISSVYKEAWIKWENKYIRYPYGNPPTKKHIDEINNLLDSLNYQKPMFRHMNTDLLDRKSSPSDEKVNQMKDGDTILLHERKYTPQTISRIVNSIDNKKENNK